MKTKKTPIDHPFTGRTEFHRPTKTHGKSRRQQIDEYDRSMMSNADMVDDDDFQDSDESEPFLPPSDFMDASLDMFRDRSFRDQFDD